jgi:hypothetical protein
VGVENLIRRPHAAGRDGHDIYTADRDARAGHRSATNSCPAGPYIGYELHLARTGLDRLSQVRTAQGDARPPFLRGAVRDFVPRTALSR